MSDPGDVTQFDDIDGGGDPEYFARFLKRARSCPGSQEARLAARERLRLQAGHTVLDAGCGLGQEAVELAGIVGPAGRTVGIDLSQAMIARAQSQPNPHGVAVHFMVGDAHRLPFADATFDACRAGSLLINVADAERVLAELVRVAKPGGRVVVLDSDNDTLFIDTPYPEITRTIVHSLTDGQHNGSIGRRLPRLFRHQGLAELEIWAGVVLIDFPVTRLLVEGIVSRAEQAGKLRPDQVARWWECLREADATGTFTAGKTVFVVAGTRH